MKVLVCGGRDYTNRKKVYDTLDKLHKRMLVLIEGGAQGADRLALEWAMENNIERESFPADWKKYGKRAGYVRNVQMLEEGKPDLVIAFPGRTGTKMMVDLAKKAGLIVQEVKE